MPIDIGHHTAHNMYLAGAAIFIFSDRGTFQLRLNTVSQKRA